METKGIELDKEREKSIHAKNIIIPIPINSTHFHRSYKNGVGKNWQNGKMKNRTTCLSVFYIQAIKKT